MRAAFAAVLVALFCEAANAQHCFGRQIPDDAWVPAEITLDDARGFVPRRLLVMRAFWESGPEAVVVEEPHEVAAMFDLLAGNERVGHACGYHRALVFQDDRGRVLTHLHNIACETYRRDAEEIDARLRTYFRALETHPTHFLINVDVDPAADPEAMARLLERNGRIVFFLSDPDLRFPRLRIFQSATGDEKQQEAIQAQARQRLERVIAALRSSENARVLEEPRQIQAQFGRNRYTILMQATVIFPLSFDERRLALHQRELALPDDADENVRIGTAVEPPFERPGSYTITVASREPYSEKLAASIKALSPMIRSVAPPERQRLGE